MSITIIHFHQNCIRLLFFFCSSCLLLLACSSTSPTLHMAPCRETDSIAPEFSLIFIIHGDGDYLWHDESGLARRADQDALIKAIKVAYGNPRAETFIFYQKPRRRKLLLFAQPDGEFYYYHCGQLCRQQSYDRGRGQSRFSPETALYQQIHSPAGKQRKLFFYLGHEIPLYNGLGYDASMKNRSCTLPDLGAGLQSLLPDSTRMDLAVLSTCYSGTPAALAAVAPYCHTIIASPENLHLSYFDLSPLEHLEKKLRSGEIPAFARQFAQNAFARLAATVQTAVSVAVYDAERVINYVTSVDSLYRQSARQTPLTPVRCDCAEEPMFVLPGMNDGIEVFYRAPNFGRNKYKAAHSGWECWKDAISHAR